MLYFKNESRHTRYNEETGELVHIFTVNNDLSLSVQMIDLSQNDLMKTSLAANATAIEAAEFSTFLDPIKTRLTAL